MVGDEIILSESMCLLLVTTVLSHSGAVGLFFLENKQQGFTDYLILGLDDNQKKIKIS